MEQWKPIEGYEKLYEISDLARVRSFHPHNNGSIMSVFLRDGYPSVILSKDGCASHHHVHRLLAKAFLPNPKNKPFAMFIDGNRQNVCLENLRWATAQELAQVSQSGKHWKDVISTIRKDYSPDLLRDLNQRFILTAI